MRLTVEQWAEYELLIRKREAARKALFQSIVGEVESFAIQNHNPLLQALEAADEEVYGFELEHKIEYLDEPPRGAVLKFALFGRYQAALTESLAKLRDVVATLQSNKWHVVEMVDGEIQWQNVPLAEELAIEACCETGVLDLPAHSQGLQECDQLDLRASELTAKVWRLCVAASYGCQPRVPEEHARLIATWACHSRRKANSDRYTTTSAELRQMAEHMRGAHNQARLRLFHWERQVQNPIRAAMQMAYGTHANADGTPNAAVLAQVEQVTSAVAEWLNYVSSTTHPCVQPERKGVKFGVIEPQSA